MLELLSKPIEILAVVAMSAASAVLGLVGLVRSKLKR
jgi:hypothetical protein